MKRTHANNNPKRQEILLKLSKCQECGKYDHSKMVQCDQCDKWSHYICVGVGDEIQKLDWSCPRCRKVPLIAPAPRPSDAIGSVVAKRFNPSVVPFVKAPRTQKNGETEMVKEGKLLKENFEKLEIEKEALKLENLHLRAFIEKSEDDYKQQLEMLKKENDDLKMKNTNLIIKIEEKETELSKLLISSDDASEENDVVVFPPLVESDCFSWPKVNYNTQYSSYDTELKKSGNIADKFVNYIKKTNYEEGLDDYIKLAAQLLFTKHFFLQCVSHKNELNRTCVKDTKIIKCLHVCIKSKFNYEGNLCDKTRRVFQDFKSDVKRTPKLWNEEI